MIGATMFVGRIVRPVDTRRLGNLKPGRTSIMIRTRTHLLRSVAVVGVAVASLTGCGKIVEKASEKAVEEAVESEGGGDVDVDFTDDGLTVESEDGDLSLAVDEDGGVQIDGTDAEGNDFSVDGEDDGSFTVTDENGEVATGQVDADGETVEFSTEEGETSFSTSEGIPEEWPDDVPEPDGLSEISGTFFSDGTVDSVVVDGSTSSEPADFFDDYAGGLIEAGFEEQSKYSESSFVNGTYVRGDVTVTVSAQKIDGSDTEVIVAIG
jgi:hypothetical protein